MSDIRLNRAVVLEARTQVSDGAGGLRAQWDALGTMWAQITPSSGKESGALGVARSAVQLRITVRAAPVGTSMRPSPDQRFREGTRLYRIQAVVEDEAMGRYLTCYAMEEVAA